MPLTLPPDYLPVIDADGYIDPRWYEFFTRGPQAAYPIGSIYAATTSADPATTLGFGTWTAFGAGKVMVGYASGDPDFGTDGATGGAKTHTLTPSQVPDNDPSANRAAGAGTVINNAAHAAGTAAAHNNLQPFIVVRLWERTA